MKEWPQYKTYHVHELEKALKAINETENPDEAAYIKELISKGGYKYPEHIEEREKNLIKKGNDPKFIILNTLLIGFLSFFALVYYANDRLLMAASFMVASIATVANLVLRIVMANNKAK
jgi:hypothetical protein